MLSISPSAVPFLIVSGVIAVLWTFRTCIAERFGKITSESETKEMSIFRNCVQRLKLNLECFVAKQYVSPRSAESVSWQIPLETGIHTAFMYYYGSKRQRSFQKLIYAFMSVLAGIIVMRGRKMKLAPVTVHSDRFANPARKS